MIICDSKNIFKDRKGVYLVSFYNHKDFLLNRYNIESSIIDLSELVLKDIDLHLKETDDIAEFNQLKVISAMNDVGLSDFHLHDSTGYGYGDMGRDIIEQIYAEVFKAEDALVRPQIVSGTHAIALCLFGILRPGDELLSVVGTPYDTLKDVIAGENCGSLKDFNINYSEAPLKQGKPSYKNIAEKINDRTKMALIQRSRGYSLRPSLTIDEIEQLIKFIKSKKKDIIIFVDNCYGEFVEEKEPIEIGADLCAGSLIKNPSGGIAPTGGYVVGKRDLVELCSYRLNAPGLGKNSGPSISTNRLNLQGFYFAPYVVGQALKGAIFASALLEKAGFEVSPKQDEKRGDIVTAIVFNDKDLLINFCRGIQKAGPVDSMVTPEPWDMPGYDHQVIMAGGSFIQGSSIELSADGPIREPYAAFIQGGLTFAHAKVGLLKALQEIYDKKLWKVRK